MTHMLSLLTALLRDAMQSALVCCSTRHKRNHSGDGAPERGVSGNDSVEAAKGEDEEECDMCAMATFVAELRVCAVAPTASRSCRPLSCAPSRLTTPVAAQEEEFPTRSRKVSPPVHLRARERGDEAHPCSSQRCPTTPAAAAAHEVCGNEHGKQTRSADGRQGGAPTSRSQSQSGHAHKPGAVGYDVLSPAQTASSAVHDRASSAAHPDKPSHASSDEAHYITNNNNNSNINIDEGDVHNYLLGGNGVVEKEFTAASTTRPTINVSPSSLRRIRFELLDNGPPCPRRCTVHHRPPPSCSPPTP